MQTTHNRTREPLYAATIFGLMFLAVLAVILFSAVAHAQGVAPAAPASPGFWATIGGFIAAHVTLDFLVVTVLPLLLGVVAKYLSAERKSQIAKAVDVAFHSLDGIHELLPAGKVADVIAKIDEVLKGADEYMAANGWAALTPAEKVAVTAQVKAAAGKVALAGAMGAALANPPKAPAAA